MWSLFSRDPTKDFAYEVGEIIPEFQGKSIWTLHEGKRKSSGEEVSVFSFDLKASSESQVQVAKASMKRLKTLRHPNIVTFLDSLETDKILYIATEKIVPLETYLREEDSSNKSQQKELAISWGLHQIIKGLSFLVNDCNLIHNNVCLASIFVDRAGEWKLGGVDYMYPSKGDNAIPPVKVLPSLERYDPPEKASSAGRRPASVWASDMWGLGCLIWEVFNGSLPGKNSLKALGKIPKNLVPNYCELVSANPKSRPNPKGFMESCTAPGGFMDNQFVKTMLFLEEIQIKDQGEKTKFFNSLPPVLDTFPEQFCKHKILPQLVHAFEFGNAGSAVLAPLFKLGKMLDTAEYQQKIVPCVVKLFSSTDRATRVKLLQQLEHFVEHLTPEVVNNQLFPSIIQGFMDSNPVVREHTIKSMMHLAPKLNYKNLNEELLKHFARLQTNDDQGGIRTNTTVCLGKIGSYVNPQMRQKVLVSAFLRAMKDPFPPARQAGILAMAASHNYFTLAESAQRLIPALSTLTVDPDKSVRDQAFKAIKCFLVKLEKVSETPELQEDMEKDVLSGTAGPGSASSWAGWAVSGMSSLTSRLVRSKGASQPGKLTTTTPDKAARIADKKEPSSQKPTPKPTSAEPSLDEHDTEEEELAEQEDGGGWEDEQGWDEDWGNMEDTGGGSASVSNNMGVEETQGGGDEDGWDEDWGSLEDTAPAHSLGYQDKDNPWGSKDFSAIDNTDSKAANSYDWGEEDAGDFFSPDAWDSNKKKKSTSISSTASSRLQSSSRSTSKSPEFGQPSKPAAQPRKSSQPTAKSTALKSTTSPAGGWDDSAGWGEDAGWEDNAWGNDDTSTAMSEADIAKQKREEKRLQRQKEMEEKRLARKAGGGAMKLGAKKVAKD